MPAQSVPEPIAELIRKEFPAWSSCGYICRADLDRFRAHYVGVVLEKEKSELAVLEGTVRQTMIDHALLSKNINIEFNAQLSSGSGFPTVLPTLQGAGHSSSLCRSDDPVNYRKFLYHCDKTFRSLSS